MRLALIARGCRPGTGIELYTYELARRLSERHEVQVLTHPQAFADCGARLVPVNAPLAPLWYSISRFSRLAGRLALAGDYDVVHTQGTDGTWGDVVTAHSCHRAAVRASLKVNATLANRVRKLASPAHRAVLRLEPRVYSSARYLVAVSHRVRRQIHTQYPQICHTPAQVIYPGVDSSHYSPVALTALRATVRAYLGWDETQVAFLLVANDLRLKGAERLFKALQHTRNPRIQLLLVSADSPDRGLIRLARQSATAGRVHFLSGRPDARKALAAADVYVGIPEYESFGISILEAMACARPLLITRNAGAAELVSDGEQGLLLPALAGTDTIAAALQHLAYDTALRRRMGQAGRTTAEHYSWDRMAAELEAVYATVNEQKLAGTA